MQNNETINTNNNNGILTKIGAIVILLLVGMFVWFLIQGVSLFQGTNTQQLQPKASLGGTIFLSLISTTGLPIPALMNVVSGDVIDLPVTKINGDKAFTLQYSVSYEDNYIVFLGGTKGSSSKESTNVLNVYLADTKGTTNLVKSLESAKVIANSSDTDYLKESPVVSIFGTVLYSSISKKAYNTAKKSLPKISASEWNIYEVNAKGTKTLLTQGLYPKWIRPGFFAFLKSDGIYTYDIKTKKEQQVWKTVNQMNIVNGFDVSDNGDYFAITNPAQNKVTIMKVMNWKEKVFSPATILSLTATNPAFSHNSGFLSMIVSWKGKTPSEKVDSGIEYYSLAEQKMLTNRTPFDMNTIDGIYVTDWR